MVAVAEQYLVTAVAGVMKRRVYVCQPRVQLG